MPGGEGPVWDVPDQALFLIDILGKKVLRYDPVRAQARQWGGGEVNDAELELISRYLVKNNAAIHSRRWQERAKPVRLELDD